MADVVLISGSPRANGNTEYALNVCKEEIEKHGLTAEIITLRGKQIQGCIACGKCGTQDCCALQDDIYHDKPSQPYANDHSQSMQFRLCRHLRK